MKTYKSIRGLVISEKSIQDGLDEIGKTEKEVRDFLGETADIYGALPDFIRSHAIHMAWFKECERRGYGNESIL